MTNEEIERRIQGIKDMAAANDGEAAHGLIDELQKDFISYIAESNDSVGDKARLVSSTSEIEFDYHCG